MHYELNNISSKKLSTDNFFDIPRTLSNSNQNNFKPTQSKKIKRIRFSPQEDTELIELVSKYGDKNWRKISEEISNKFSQVESSTNKIIRTPRQCKERYLNYLSPEINDKQWTAEEDQCLMLNATIIQSHWRSMQKLFPGRSEVAIRNRFNYLHRSYMKELKPAFANQISTIKFSKKNGIVEIEQPSIQNEIQKNSLDHANFLNFNQSFLNSINSNVVDFCCKNNANFSSSLNENEDRNDKKKVIIPHQWIEAANTIIKAVQTDEVKNSISELKKKVENLSENLACQNKNTFNIFNIPFEYDLNDETDFFEMF